ncbi:hypothetical protein QZH41_019591, partial [Actinostola sp. cb2023]
MPVCLSACLPVCLSACLPVCLSACLPVCLSASTRYGWTAWSEYTPCDKRCRRSRERYCYHNGNVKMCGGNVNMYGIEKQVIDCLRCPDKDDTDFEGNRMGIWHNTKGDDFDWTLHTWFTQTMLTGPMKDHTSGKGYYLYIESSIPRRPGDKARLVTSWLPFVRGGQCIKFAYSMYGRTTGRLSLMVEMKDRNVKYSIFLKKGNQGEGWKSGMGNIDMPPSVQYRCVPMVTPFNVPNGRLEGTANPTLITCLLSVSRVATCVVAMTTTLAVSSGLVEVNATRTQPTCQRIAREAVKNASKTEP